ncbi:MAG: PGPGW domain-containing protein [Pseudomonadota bacterium]
MYDVGRRKAIDPQLQTLLVWGSAFSLVCLIGTLVAVPWVVARLPKDYFNRDRRQALRERSNEPWYALLLTVTKNAVGALLVLLGLIMLVTPGQGILTLLVGLLLMNFPGKYQLERWLVMRPGVMKGLAWLRTRSGQPPFDPPAF